MPDREPQRAPDRRRLDAVGKPRAYVVRLRKRMDLRGVLETSERRGIHDAVEIADEGATERRFCPLAVSTGTLVRASKPLGRHQLGPGHHCRTAPPPR